jgi:hypothetical protein
MTGLVTLNGMFTYKLLSIVLFYCFKVLPLTQPGQIVSHCFHYSCQYFSLLPAFFHLQWLQTFVHVFMATTLFFIQRGLQIKTGYYCHGVALHSTVPVCLCGAAGLASHQTLSKTSSFPPILSIASLWFTLFTKPSDAG